MLLGVEHIQFCVRDPGAARSYLESVGYRTVFEARGFDGGTRLPRYRAAGRSMVYLSGAGSAIELIDGEAEAQTTGYTPVVPRTMLDGAAVSGGETFRVPELDADCRQAETGGCLSALRLETPRLEASVRFWRALGGRVARAGATTFEASFEPRIATMPLQLTLQATDEPRQGEPFVDELGCRLVAFLSTSLEADLERIAEAGGRPSDVRCLTIHGRALRVAFVVAPSAELVEIIEARR